MLKTVMSTNSRPCNAASVRPLGIVGRFKVDVRASMPPIWQVRAGLVGAWRNRRRQRHHVLAFLDSSVGFETLASGYEHRSNRGIGGQYRITRAVWAPKKNHGRLAYQRPTFSRCGSIRGSA